MSDEEFVKEFRKRLFSYSYYDDTGRCVGIIKKKEIEKMLNVDVVEGEEFDRG